MNHTVRIREEDRQLVLLAIAELSLTRPGWLWTLGELADQLHGRAMFDDFRRFNADKVALRPPPRSALVKLRDAFDLRLIREVKDFGGIPALPPEEHELRAAIAELLLAAQLPEVTMAAIVEERRSEQLRIDREALERAKTAIQTQVDDSSINKALDLMIEINMQLLGRVAFLEDAVAALRAQETPAPAIATAPPATA